MSNQIPGGTQSFETAFVLDEQRKRLVNERTFTPLQKIEYDRSYYNTFRPDLTPLDQQAFSQKIALGESLLNEMRKRLNFETKRIYFTSTPSDAKYRVQALEDQIYALSMPHIRSGRIHTDRTWDEYTKLVNFVDKKIFRIKTYALEYPNLMPVFTKEQCKQKEDQVFDLFVREMRKAPHQKAAQSEE